MPVTLTVRQVRDALWRAEQEQGAVHTGGASRVPAKLGTWFHGWMNQILSEGSPSGILDQLAGVDTDVELWKQTLRETVYNQLVGPTLTREHAILHEFAEETLLLWDATRGACDWIAELVWQVRPKKSSQSLTTALPWQTFRQWNSLEERFECTLQRAGWSDSVRLVGVPDAILRLDNRDTWCALEFKLGKTNPTVDLGQACLYHLLISKAQSGPNKTQQMPQGTLALVSFHPERKETLFTADQLIPAHDRLYDLIGVLAGVANGAADSSAKVEGTSGEENASPPRPQRKQSPAGAGPDHEELCRGIVETLAEYGVEVSVDEPPIIGPTFIRVPLNPGRGVTFKKVEKYPTEIRLRLKLAQDPFINLDERGLSIDIQRPDRQTLLFEDFEHLFSTPDYNSGAKIPVGVDLHGRLECADLDQPENSHLLVAGTTGSGKSEWLRTAIAGLILANTPETLRFVLVDPKRNAFHALRNSPYLWRPLVFPDEHPVVTILEELIEEMERRYRMFDGLDNYAQLAAQSDTPLPRIVCVCDEYRDLISRDAKERKQIEQCLFRLGAKARAAGIHLILATQEPSRDTIRGPLDSNMPARIGLKMAKNTESRMLLTTTGAEKLLGHGDLLFKDLGEPRRLQAPLLSAERRNALFGVG